MYNGEISKRLKRFLDQKVIFVDIGDAESGPMVSVEQNAPDWAVNLEKRATDLEGHMKEIRFINFLYESVDYELSLYREYL
jgi:hypothetical protein